MNRRNLFKMLGAAAVGAVCAPLVKLFPEPRPRLTINKWADRKYLTSKDLALSIDDFSEFYIRPWAKRMADYADAQALKYLRETTIGSMGMPENTAKHF